MSLVWLVTLLIYHGPCGGTVPTVAWLLMFPFILQDAYDVIRAK